MAQKTGKNRRNMTTAVDLGDTVTVTLDVSDASALVAFMEGETPTVANIDAAARATAAIHAALHDAIARAWGRPQEEVAHG